MRLRVTAFFVISLFCIGFTKAQTNLSIKELEEVVKQDRQDRDQVDVMNILSEKYVGSNLKKALRYAERAEKLAEELSYFQGQLAALTRLGKIQAFNFGRHDKAVLVYEKAYLVYKQLYEADEISQKTFKKFMVDEVLESYNKLVAQKSDRNRDKKAKRAYQRLQGEFATYLADFAETSEEALRAKKTALDSAAQTIHTMEEELDSTEAEIKKKTYQIHKTQQSQKELSEQKEELFDSLVARDFMQDELQDSLIAREMRLKDTRLKVLENKAQVLQEQAKVAKLKRENERKRNIIFISALVVSLVFVILIIIFFSLRRQRILNRKLEKQKQELSDFNETTNRQNEEILAQQNSIMMHNNEILLQKARLQKKNKQILASINYAERIQSAILPTEQRVKKILPECFVFFRPRDIVSGDFYWFNAVNGNLVIAAVDCTGHGIPGAFMSMIGNTLLKEIVERQKITAPDVILNEMHRRVQSTLQQDKNQSRDGMDMSICTINLRKNELCFAGAKRPLLYIKENELFQIKGDRKAIGGEEGKKIRIFTKHTIALDTPTILYMFSDGYIDQFGGIENRKFSIKRLKELLFDMRHLPMKAQHDALGKNLNDWMNANEKIYQKQLDDILVMGFKYPN